MRVREGGEGTRGLLHLVLAFLGKEYRIAENEMIAVINRHRDCSKCCCKSIISKTVPCTSLLMGAPPHFFRRDCFQLFKSMSELVRLTSHSSSSRSYLTICDLRKPVSPFCDEPLNKHPRLRNPCLYSTHTDWPVYHLLREKFQSRHSY